MNEDGSPAAPVDAPVSANNIDSEEGGVSADEVASVLNLSKAEVEEVPAEPESTEKEVLQTPVDKTEPVESEEPTEATPQTLALPELPETPNFAVEVEDASGTKFVIGPDDSIDEVLADFEPKNNGQIFKIIEDHMQAKADKKAFDAEQATAQAEAAQVEQIATIQAGWDKEIQKLQGDKRLPLDAKIEERRNEVFKFMADENDRRQADGRPLLQSFEDALDKLENREHADADEKAKKDAKDEARRRGGLVGGSSAPATSGAPAYRAGQARSASEAIYSLGLLDK